MIGEGEGFVRLDARDSHPRASPVGYEWLSSGFALESIPFGTLKELEYLTVEFASSEGITCTCQDPARKHALSTKASHTSLERLPGARLLSLSIAGSSSLDLSGVLLDNLQGDRVPDSARYL